MKINSNRFIQAALEELQQEANVGSQTDAGNSPSGVVAENAPAAAATAVTETNIDSNTDAVAELMEKNSELQTENTELQEESFDNDVDAIAASSDSVTDDLEETVQAGAALEELAHIANMTAKSGQANQASVAGLYMALEAISRNAGLKSSGPALEALALDGPQGQAESIGKEAMGKAKELGKRLIASIKRIIGWVIGIVRQLLTRSAKLAERANAALELISEGNALDRTKSIDASPFITSLRLVEGGGDANQQFKAYGALASKTLFGFFNDSFVSKLNATFESSIRGGSQQPGAKELNEILKLLMGTVFTENGNSGDSGAPESVSDRDLTVGKTVPCVGGSQLYLAATLDLKPSDTAYYHIGLVKNQPKFDTPKTIPVVDRALAEDMLPLIRLWMGEQKNLENRLKKLENMGKDFEPEPGTTIPAVQQFLSVLTTLATSCIPQFLRLNIQNSTNFIAYVEKSVSVSKAAAPEKK